MCLGVHVTARQVRSVDIIQSKFHQIKKIKKNIASLYELRSVWHFSNINKFLKIHQQHETTSLKPANT